MTDFVDIPVRLDMDELAAPFSRALATLDSATTRVLDSAAIERPLRELVRIRASQLNGCTYCVDVHTTDALAAGDTVRRIAAVAVWGESGVTLAASTRVPDHAFDAARAQFTDTELAAILSLIVTINAWNTVGVAARPWPVEYA